MYRVYKEKKTQGKSVKIIGAAEVLQLIEEQVH